MTLYKKYQTQIQELTNSYEYIYHQCEEYSDIKEFVSLLFGDDQYISNQLLMLVYNMNRMDITTIHDLESFIANYIFDDSGYEVVQDQTNPKLVCLNSSDNNGVIRDLIEAAKHNADYHRKRDQKIMLDYIGTSPKYQI